MGRQATIFYLAANSEFSAKEVEIKLYRSFIEAYQNRVTIDASFTVDKAMKGPQMAALDGDLHFAGTSPQVAMVTVAEIQNAARYPKAVEIVKRADSTGRPLSLSGVWRVWPEHSGSAKEEQGKPVAAPDSYRPDHVFEIHPITRLGGTSLLESISPVTGFSPGIAEDTFPIYEKTVCKLMVQDKTISIVTRKGMYNDVEFIMEIADDHQLVVRDGRFVWASALDMKGHVVAEHVRMAFIKGTQPERAVRSLRRGARLHVFAMPRMSFAEVLRRVRASAKDPSELTRPVPYELVVGGVFEDKK
jgi:hypothetical protein